MKSEDMEITDEKLTAVYSLVVDVSDSVRERRRERKREGTSEKEREKRGELKW